MVKKWFKPKRVSGFSKEKSVEDNIKTMMRNADKRLSREKRMLRVGRQAQSLANVMQDKATKAKAQAVADKAFQRLK